MMPRVAENDTKQPGAMSVPVTNRMRSLTELFDLTGRTAIVTGGSRGLGEEMAEGLAEAGASLMLCARREQWLTPTLDAFRSRGFTVDGMVLAGSRWV